MHSFVLTPPLFGFVVGTRVALAFGMGLLVASRIPESRRKAIAMTLIGLGAATTVPAARLIFKSRDELARGGADGGHAVRTVADM